MSGGVSLTINLSSLTVSLSATSGTPCTSAVTTVATAPSVSADCPTGTDLDANPQAADGTTVFVPKACTPAEPGSYAKLDGSTKTVDLCAKGTYNELWGAAACEPCLGLTAAVATGATKCQECAAGTTPSAAKDTCNLCPVGQYNTIPGSACINW